MLFMRKINFNSAIKENETSNLVLEQKLTAHASQFIDTKDDNMQSLLRANPGKLLYSIRETATMLGVSYEFVRAKVYGQQVNFKQFGSRKLIHISELARLISEGLTS